MWNLLRLPSFNEFHFRRQVRLGNYFVDFASHQANVVIEIDGETHTSESARRADTIRENFISSQGYRVLRFTNADLMSDREAVFTYLLSKLTPTRSGFAGPPSPQGGGKGQS